LVHSTVIHAQPVLSGLNAQRLSEAGLVLAEETIWGEERVERFLRASNAR